MTVNSRANVLHLPTKPLPDTPISEASSFAPEMLTIYRLLVTRGRMTAAELTRTTGMEAGATLEAIAELGRLSLISQMGSYFLAVPQIQAVDEIISQQAHQLSEALEGLRLRQRQIRMLFQHRALLDEEQYDRVTTVALGQIGTGEFFELPTDATRTLSAIHPGGGFTPAVLSRSLGHAERNLKRGVQLRVIHQASSLAHPAVLQYLLDLERLGGSVSIQNSLPARLLLIDDETAICTLPSRQSADSTFLLRGQKVVLLLTQMFESTWLEATPLQSAIQQSAAQRPGIKAEGNAEASTQGGPLRKLTAAQELILRQLALGHTDQAIARTLGITTRTVTRRVGEIYAILGVDSRFQAGIAALRYGIV